MPLLLIATFVLLILVTLFGLNKSNLPKNIWLLFLAQPLAMSAAPMIVLSGGILAAKMAPSPELATLPLTLMILGIAAGVAPASMLMKKIGRKRGTIIGFCIAIIGSVVMTFSAIYISFIGLIVGTILLGLTMSFVSQLRFAALESLHDPKLNPKAISVLMTSGIFAAIIGPEITVVAAELIDSPYGFAGSFLSLALLYIVAIVIISQLDSTQPAKEEIHTNARPLSVIAKQPIFIIAISASTIGYSIMSYIMTASPLSMHEMHGYDLQEIKWVIQSHIIAMYLPSLVTAKLVNVFGLNKLMTIGSVLYFIVVIVVLSGESVMHYWWAMVFLGIGWNFLFTSGTLLLPESYHDNERFKVQAMNDFGVFLIQALASLSAGIILFQQGWTMLVSITVPVILLMLIITFWFYRIKISNERLETDHSKRKNL